MDNNTDAFKALVLVGKAFAPLTEDEKNILLKRYGFLGDKITLEAIGKELDVTKERVRQKQERAIDKFNIAYNALTKNNEV